MCNKSSHLKNSPKSSIFSNKKNSYHSNRTSLEIQKVPITLKVHRSIRNLSISKDERIVYSKPLVWAKIDLSNECDKKLQWCNEYEKEGLLEKFSKKGNGEWKKKYCVLKDFALAYYKSKESKDPQTVLSFLAYACRIENNSFQYIWI